MSDKHPHHILGVIHARATVHRGTRKTCGKVDLCCVLCVFHNEHMIQQ